MGCAHLFEEWITLKSAEEQTNYTKILIARFSPENSCFANDAEMLVVASIKDKMQGRLRKGDNFFVGINTKKPSLYGWVKTVENGITAEELAALKNPDPDIDEIKKAELLLKCAAKHPEGTAMFCHFVDVVSPEGKEKIMKITKIFLHNG